MKTWIILVLALLVSVSNANAAGDALPPKQLVWKFDGMLGKFDRRSIQRGLQVYKEVCAACHSLDLLSYRNLQSIGLSVDEVKAFAAEYEIQDGPDDTGEMFMRPARPSDRFVSPYPNERAARASNGGAYPPDLSLMVKARPDGANYTFSLLTGYGNKVPKTMQMSEGMNYNPYFPTGQIAMAAPLSEGLVEYQDGTKATVDQMAKDVVYFLQWAAEPEMEKRKQMGIRVLMFLAVFTFLCILAKRRIWNRIQDHYID